MFGPQEQNPPAVTASKSMYEGFLRVNSVDMENMVSHVRHWRVRLVDGVHDRIAQEPGYQFVDAVVEGRREQHALASGRCGGKDAGDRGQEAEIGHMIGFVQNGDLDPVQADQALLHQILKSTGTGHNDIHARLERSDLTSLRNTTEDRGDLQSVALRQRLQCSGDLGGEFPSGRQDQSRRLAGIALTAVESADHGDRKGQRFTAARLAATEYVPAGQSVGQCLDLDGKGRCDAELGQFAD